MVRTASLFSQLLQHFPRWEFASLVRSCGAERHAKGFTCWSQLVAMLFCHLGRAQSLREICNGLSSCLGKLSHLGIVKAPKRSTLAYANEHRPAELYESLFWRSLEVFREQGGLTHRPKRFRFKNKLLSLDSTAISLCLSLFPWAEFRQTKGGVKLHVLLDHDDYLPSYAVLTSARRADVRIARTLQLKAGSIVVMDRAYNDFGLFGRWCEEGILFVTRMKEGTRYDVMEDRPLPAATSIVSDQLILLSSTRAQKDCPQLLRRVLVWDADNEREIVLLTNHLGFAATTISAIYKDRWQIELFFKALKQNLKIKTFVGTTENALRIQIWTALLALLLLRWLHYLSQAKWSLSNLAAMLRFNLFTYRDLEEWLKSPFDTPPETEPPEQLHLTMPALGQLN